MKKLLIFALLSFFIIQGQEATDPVQPDIKVGDVLIIGKPSSSNYKHVHFPKANFIIKKGGIANYKTLFGERVVVTAIDKKEDGDTSISIKKADGNKFFNSVTVVKATFEKAIEKKEILLN